jgi:hypothetical protein
MHIGSRITVAVTRTCLFALIATTANVEAQQQNASLMHFAHVATGFNGAPGGRGLTMTAAIETNTAMMYANFAAGRTNDLDAMKTNVRNVLHAVAPAKGSQGPGLGFGLKQAAELIATQIGLALKAPGASETMKKLGPNVATAARSVAARAQAVADLGAKVLAAQTAAEAAPLVEQLRTMALELDTGKDVNANGRRDFDAVEPGMNQLEAQVYSIFEGEKLPRILS